LTQALLDLREAGNSIIIIEHNLELVACADWVIDMGPEGGDGGGLVVVEGTPEQVAECKGSHTGHALKEILQNLSDKAARSPASKAEKAPAAPPSKQQNAESKSRQDSRKPAGKKTAEKPANKKPASKKTATRR